MPYLLTLDPVLLRLGPVTIHYYGLFLVSSIVICYWWLKKSTAQPWLPDLYLIGTIGAFVGAKVVFTGLHWLERDTVTSPAQSVMELINTGGLSFHGALVGGLIASHWYAKRRNIDLLPLLDQLSLILPLAIILVRLGNFINQELLGRPTDRMWGIVFSLIDSTPRHPVQLYEAIAALVILFACWLVVWFRKKTSQPEKQLTNQLIFVFLLLYSLGRFITDFFREQSYLIGPLSLAQWSSIGIILTISVIYSISVKKKINI